jgi:phospholipase C
LGDELSQQHVSWKWYSGGWNDALAGRPDPLFQWHHQPYAYFDHYAAGTIGRAAHLQDEQSFFNDLYGDNLPAVSFIKPLGPDNEHPGYANLIRGQQHVADIVHAVQNSSAWDSTAIIVTYDENGGRWDHVPPPSVSRWGLGTRVPGIIISPYARTGYVDHTQYETLSIDKSIEEAFGLNPLTEQDANATSFLNAFDFGGGSPHGKSHGPGAQPVLTPALVDPLLATTIGRRVEVFPSLESVGGSDFRVANAGGSSAALSQPAWGPSTTSSSHSETKLGRDGETSRSVSQGSIDSLGDVVPGLPDLSWSDLITFP